MLKRPEISPATDEHQLLEQWRQGDAIAGQKLFEAHYASMARFFRNKVPSSVRPDLIQQTFLAALERPDRFEGRSSLRTYLLGIARHKLYEYVRQTYRHRRLADPDELVLYESPLSPELAVGIKEERRLVLEGLRRIPLKYQVVLELAYWETLSSTSIAEVIGWPVGTVKTRLRDGRARLERELKRISRSNELLKSTLDSLEQWSRRVREARV